MKFTTTSALLGAAALSQAASLRHGHAHAHTRRAPEAAPAVAFMEQADVTALTSLGVQTGTNAIAGAAAVGVGTVADTNGKFTMHLSNQGQKDLIVVSWFGANMESAITACFLSAAKPAITHTLKAGTNTTFTFDPSQAGGQISGGLAPFYPGSTTLTSFSGQADNTWVEFTFENKDQFSTTDVSRLINMGGSKVEVHNYPDEETRAAGKPACSSTMTACSFVCPDGSNSCTYGGTLQDCPIGGAGNVAGNGGADGGCGGMSQTGGVVQVNFWDPSS